MYRYKKLQAVAIQTKKSTAIHASFHESSERVDDTVRVWVAGCRTGRGRTGGVCGMAAARVRWWVHGGVTEAIGGGGGVPRWPSPDHVGRVASTGGASVSAPSPDQLAKNGFPSSGCPKGSCGCDLGVIGSNRGV